MLTWLRQLEEYFYKIGGTNENRDWNTHGKYCPVKAQSVTKDFPLENIHMSKANNTTVEKNTSVSWIKPDNKINKKAVKSLEEWAEKSCVGTTITSKTKQLQITKQRIASIEQKHTDQNNMLCQTDPTN